MVNTLSQEAAEKLLKEYNYLIGKPMPYPFSSLPITSITLEKNQKSKGFSIILSHEIFDNGWPETTGFRCPQVKLHEYLAVMITPYL